ncbi:hypothetical protein TIFTF001_041908 [Ficus carica]|uniref:S-locus glycoprotein domain-containing protein n=1 Tax=Ficus carica TaxID=3494 RepID=A0AA87ZX32_FICCA|nr:hypothetical protein TIFTF001_041908 [Ficus carica]
MELYPNQSSYNIVWNRSRRYWTSGSWNGKTFSLMPEMNRGYFYDFKFVSNDNETYFTYSVYNTSIQTSLIVMDVSGMIKQKNWMPSTGWTFFYSQPKQQCEDAWDLEDYSDGCKRETELQCGSSNLDDEEVDRFQEISSVSLPVNEASVLDLLNLKNLTEGDSNGSPLYFRLAAHPKESSRSQNRRCNILFIGIISSAVIISCAACPVYYLRRKKLAKKRGNRRNIQGNRVANLYDSESRIKDFLLSEHFREDEKKGIEVPFVVLESILAATDNYSEANKLAEGGLGPAWKLWNENKAIDLMDPTLSENCNENESLGCFNVRLLCVQDDASDRPTMSNVLFMFGNESGGLPSPKQPAFVVRRSVSSKGSAEKPLSNNQ